MYLLIAFGCSIMVSLYFIINYKKYSKIFVIGIVLFSLAVILVGIDRLAEENLIAINQKILHLIIAFLFILGLPFFYIGLYLTVRHDPVKRRNVIIQIIGMSTIVLMFISIFLMKSLEN